MLKRNTLTKINNWNFILHSQMLLNNKLWEILKWKQAVMEKVSVPAVVFFDYAPSVSNNLIGIVLIKLGLIRKCMVLYTVASKTKGQNFKT